MDHHEGDGRLLDKKILYREPKTWTVAKIVEAKDKTRLLETGEN